MRVWRYRAAAAMAIMVLIPVSAAPGAALAAPDDTATVTSVIEAQKALAKVAKVLHRPTATAESGVVLSGIGGATAVGAEHTCALVLFTNVWCWGANADGQLGDGTTSASTVPVRASATGGLRDKIVLGITAGRAHSCALAFDLDSFSAYCWGANNEGQLGDGGLSSRSRPVEVANDVIGIAAGAEHTCALTADMTVSCWGRNNAGQLGFDTGGAAEPTPQEVPGLSDIVTISANDNNTCAVDVDGKAYCWGSDTHGQLGDGGGASGTPSASPQAVVMTGVTNGFSRISVGRRHVCGLDASLVEYGRAWCWGDDTDGQLGNGATVADFSRPAPVAGNRTFVSINAGGDSACATGVGGKGYCWGANADGQLGTGDRIGHTLPTAVDQSHVQVSNPVRLLYGVPESMIVDDIVGDAHGCATDAQLTIYCTGSNSAGQIGDGTTADTDVLTALPLAPGAARNVRTAVRDGALRVSWTAPSAEGAAPVAGYIAVASDGTSAEALENAMSCDTAGALTCTVEGLDNNRRYTVFVLAVSAGGASYSGFAYGTPKGGGSGGGLPITGPGMSLATGLVLLAAGMILTLVGKVRHGFRDVARGR